MLVQSPVLDRPLLRVPARRPDALSVAAMPAWATALATVNALAFLVVQPGVGDLWAARAREHAAAHDVGLTYWFSWFSGGTTPGSYSVATPELSTWVGAPELGAIATIAITPLVQIAVRGTRCPLGAVWVATVAAGLSLWSGRIPFALGTAMAVAAIVAVRARLHLPAGGFAVLAVLCSPVCGAFLALGMVGPLVIERSHRAVCATTLAAALGTLGAIGLVFGSPGPQLYPNEQALLTELCLLALLAARPPRHLQVVIVVGLVACPLTVLVPNGLGSNLTRLAWLWLPVAVVATARIPLRRAVFVAAAVVAVGVQQHTVKDLQIATAPIASKSHYDPLIAELQSVPDLDSYRLEVVDDGTKTSAYALLPHAMLARGYQTQTDRQLNAVLRSKDHLTASSYREWLDANAVGFVALSTDTLDRNAEYELVSRGTLPYLNAIWQSPDWTLFRVVEATPIVGAPGRILQADPSSVTVDVPCACTLPVRVRWSKFLAVDPVQDGLPARIRSDGEGWTSLTTLVPGTYVLHGGSPLPW